MKSFRLWIFIVISWICIDWIIAGDVLLKWAGVHGNNSVLVYVIRFSFVGVCWIVWQRLNAWRKLSTYRGLFICALAATPVIPLIRIIQVIVNNSSVVSTAPRLVAVSFISAIVILVMAKVVVIIYWWRKLQNKYLVNYCFL